MGTPVCFARHKEGVDVVSTEEQLVFLRLA